MRVICRKYEDVNFASYQLFQGCRKAGGTFDRRTIVCRVFLLTLFASLPGVVRTALADERPVEGSAGAPVQAGTRVALVEVAGKAVEVLDVPRVPGKVREVFHHVTVDDQTLDGAAQTRGRPGEAAQAVQVPEEMENAKLCLE